jgi:hypothetical protein
VAGSGLADATLERMVVYRGSRMTAAQYDMIEQGETYRLCMFAAASLDKAVALRFVGGAREGVGDTRVGPSGAFRVPPFVLCAAFVRGCVVGLPLRACAACVGCTGSGLAV